MWMGEIKSRQKVAFMKCGYAVLSVASSLLTGQIVSSCRLYSIFTQKSDKDYLKEQNAAWVKCACVVLFVAFSP